MIARCRSSITKEMFIEIANLACNSDPTSATSVTFDCLALGRILGLRATEYAKNTQNRVNVYEYASGKKVDL